MVIEKVFGLSATSVSLNDRFTMMSAAAPSVTSVKAAPIRNTPTRNTPAYGGRLFSDTEVGFKPSIKQRLIARTQFNTIKQQQAWQYSLIKQALLRGALGQGNVKNRLGLKRSNARGVRYRWYRANGVPAQRLQFLRRARPFNTQRLRGRGRGRPRGQGMVQGSQQSAARAGGVAGGGAGAAARRGRPVVRGARTRGRGRGQGRGGITRQQSQQSVLSKEQLDAELEQYMSCTKTALDKQLDEYMQDALMDFPPTE